MRKQPEITEATRREFIGAFCEFYRTRPIEKITVTEIAEKAGYNRSTFYQYFRDVYDVLSYIEDDQISFIMENVAVNVKGGRVPDNFIAAFANMLVQREEYINVLFGNPYNPYFISRLKEKVMPVFFDMFHLSAEDTKAIYALEFYLAGLFSVFNHWFQNGKDMPVEELGALIKGILQDGVLAQMERTSIQ